MLIRGSFQRSIRLPPKTRKHTLINRAHYTTLISRNHKFNMPGFAGVHGIVNKNRVNKTRKKPRTNSGSKSDQVEIHSYNSNVNIYSTNSSKTNSSHIHRQNSEPWFAGARTGTPNSTPKKISDHLLDVNYVPRESSSRESSLNQKFDKMTDVVNCISDMENQRRMTELEGEIDRPWYCTVELTRQKKCGPFSTIFLKNKTECIVSKLAAGKKWALSPFFVSLFYR